MECSVERRPWNGAQRELAHLIDVAHLGRLARMAAPRSSVSSQNVVHASPLSRLLSKQRMAYHTHHPALRPR